MVKKPEGAFALSLGKAVLKEVHVQNIITKSVTC